MLVGLEAGLFRGPLLFAFTAVLLLAIADALLRRLRMGAFAGAAWALVILALSLFVLTRLSISYSFAARLFLFGPAFVVNSLLLITLCRKASAKRVSWNRVFRSGIFMG